MRLELCDSKEVLVVDREGKLEFVEVNEIPDSFSTDREVGVVEVVPIVEL